MLRSFPRVAGGVRALPLVAVRVVATSLAALLLLAVLSPMSFANGRSPATECAEAGGFVPLGKYDSADIDHALGAISPELLGITVTITSVKVDDSEVEARGFTWASSTNTTPVRAVVVAGGPTENTRTYTPGVLSDGTELLAPGNAGISHITFCYAPSPADLVVTKAVSDPDGTLAGGEQFGFEVTCGTVTVEDVVLADGGSWSWNDDSGETALDEDASCSVDEVVTHGGVVAATFNTVASGEDTVEALVPGTNTFAVTNTFAAAPAATDLVVTKTVAGDDQPAQGTPFGFRVICATEMVATFTLADGGSWAWNADAPAWHRDVEGGDRCTVEELDAAGADRTSAQLGAADHQLGTVFEIVTGTNTVAVTNVFNRTTRIDDEREDDPVVPAIRLDKSADDDAYSVGETITYTYVVTNTGETTLSTITLRDDVLGDLTGRLPTRELAPGESTEVTVLQVALGDHVPSLTNVAVTSGVSPANGRVSATDEVTVDVVEVLGIVIERPAPPILPAPAPNPRPQAPAPAPAPTPVAAPVAVLGEELARTGVDAGALAALAAAMLTAGTLLLLRRRAA